MNKIKKYYIIIFMIIVILLFIVIVVILYNIKLVNKSYLMFIDDLNFNNVFIVVVDSFFKMIVILNNGDKYFIDNLYIDILKEKLLLNGIDVKDEINFFFIKIIFVSIFVLLFVIFGVIFIFKVCGGVFFVMFMEMQDFSKNKKDVLNFNVVVGNEEVKESLMDIVDFFKNFEKY